VCTTRHAENKGKEMIQAESPEGQLRKFLAVSAAYLGLTVDVGALLGFDRGCGSGA